jgi:hypothetical protein
MSGHPLPRIPDCLLAGEGYGRQQRRHIAVERPALRKDGWLRQEPCRRLQEVDMTQGTREAVIDAHEELIAEQASRMAVTAATADLEYWARTISVGGRIGLNDLVRILDTLRDASITETSVS